jgi:hypothetical protein
MGGHHAPACEGERRPTLGYVSSLWIMSFLPSLAMRIRAELQPPQQQLSYVHTRLEGRRDSLHSPRPSASECHARGYTGEITPGA